MKVDYDDLLTNYYEKQEIIENQDKKIIDLQKEIERLHSIIKEVREYIEEMQVWDYEYNDFVVLTKGALEILDKENENERIDL